MLKRKKYLSIMDWNPLPNPGVIAELQTIVQTTEPKPLLPFSHPVYALKVEGEGSTEDYKVEAAGRIFSLTSEGTWADLSEDAAKLHKAAQDTQDIELARTGLPLRQTLNFSKIHEVRLVRPDATSTTPVTIQALLQSFGCRRCTKMFLH